MSKKKYYYRNNEGEMAWHDQPLPEFGKENAKKSGRRLGTIAWATGLVSDAAGVHPNQVSEFRDDAQKNGFTGVSFTEGGDCVFHSRRERARYLKHRGLFDRNGGYGD